MPKLIIFAACEKVIVDSTDNTISLMTLLGDIQVWVIPGTPVPKGTEAPMHWAAFALWQRDSDDEGKTYQSRCALISASGDLLVESVAPAFEMTRVGHNNTHKFSSFPVWESGKCWLKLWLREAEGTQWAEVASYPIGVIHISPPAPT